MQVMSAPSGLLKPSVTPLSVAPGQPHAEQKDTGVLACHLETGVWQTLQPLVWFLNHDLSGRLLACVSPLEELRPMADSWEALNAFAHRCVSGLAGRLSSFAKPSDDCSSQQRLTGDPQP